MSKMSILCGQAIHKTGTSGGKRHISFEKESGLYYLLLFVLL